MYRANSSELYHILNVKNYINIYIYIHNLFYNPELLPPCVGSGAAPPGCTRTISPCSKTCVDQADVSDMTKWGIRIFHYSCGLPNCKKPCLAGICYDGKYIFATSLTIGAPQGVLHSTLQRPFFSTQHIADAILFYIAHSS